MEQSFLGLSLVVQSEPKALNSREHIFALIIHIFKLDSNTLRILINILNTALSEHLQFPS
jgi:hypothetical protein